MVEVAKAVVLPEGDRTQPRELFTPLLVWDQLELTLPPIIPDDEAHNSWVEGLARLVDLGVITIKALPLLASDRKKLFDESTQRGIDFRQAQTDEDLEREAQRLADIFVAARAHDIREAMVRAHARGLGVLALSSFSSALATLPEVAPHESARESALVQASVTGLQVLPGTDLDDILAFREKHSAQMGRFRGALVDLAATLNRDASPIALAAQADAVIRNRIEPALADLESVLSKGRIRYAWATLLGASAVVLGSTTPLAAATGGGRIVSQTLAYAFDRKKLIAAHPYGLLHAIRSDIADLVRDTSARRIVDPLQGPREAYAAGVVAGIKYERDRDRRGKQGT